MDEIRGGSAGNPKGSVNAALNLWHEVGDWTFFGATLFIVFNPEVSSDGDNMRHHGLFTDR